MVPKVKLEHRKLVAVGFFSLDLLQYDAKVDVLCCER